MLSYADISREPWPECKNVQSFSQKPVVTEQFFKEKIYFFKFIPENQKHLQIEHFAVI